MTFIRPYTYTRLLPAQPISLSILIRHECESSLNKQITRKVRTTQIGWARAPSRSALELWWAHQCMKPQHASHSETIRRIYFGPKNTFYGKASPHRARGDLLVRFCGRLISTSGRCRWWPIETDFIWNFRSFYDCLHLISEPFSL